MSESWLQKKWYDSKHRCVFSQIEIENITQRIISCLWWNALVINSLAFGNPTREKPISQAWWRHLLSVKYEMMRRWRMELHVSKDGLAVKCTVWILTHTPTEGYRFKNFIPPARFATQHKRTHFHTTSFEDSLSCFLLSPCWTITDFYLRTFSQGLVLKTV